MSFRNLLSRPLKDMERRFGRDQRKSDRIGADVAREGSGADSTDSFPQPESAIVASPRCGKGEGEGDGGEGEVGPIRSPPQPKDLVVASEDERERELRLGKMGVDEGEVGLMDLSLHSGSEEVGSRHSRGKNAVVDGELGPVEVPPQSYLGISGDQETSSGVWRMSFESLPDL